MPKIIFVRHGQAQFGQANYDKLSDVGHEQAVALGTSLLEQGITIDHWVRGDMVRHAETLGCITGHANAGFTPNRYTRFK